MTSSSLPNKPCQCWTCQSLSPKVKQFREGLTPEQLKLFDTLFDELWDHYENDSLELDVLRAKIEGNWPKEEGDNKYYERMESGLYEVRGILIEESIREQCSKHVEKQAIKDADEFIVGQLLSKL